MRQRIQFEERTFIVELLNRDPLEVRITTGEEEPQTLRLAGRHESGRGRLTVDGHPFTYFVTDDVDKVWVTLNGQTFCFDKVSAGGSDELHGGFEAPMPGKILQVNVAAGDAVSTGQVLVVMEAMKMEHRIEAPADGTITALHCAAGDLVDQGKDLLAFTPTEA